MQNIVMNRPMCETLHYYRLRNDRALGNGKSDNNKNNNNKKNSVGSALGPVSGSEKLGRGIACVLYIQEAQLLLGDRATRKHVEGC